MGKQSAFNTNSAASRKFPPQFWAEDANAVLDAETGELLEYRHLMQKASVFRDVGHLI